MQIRFFTFILLVLSLTFFSVHVFAGEEKEKPAAEKSEKAEGKEGGEKKEAKGEGKEGEGKKEGGEDSMPWLAIEAKIQELSAKIDSKKEEIEKLLEEKEKLKDNSPELKEKIKDIIAQHKAMEKYADDYSSQINLLKYRYPERHAKRDRKYDRVEVKSVEEMEQAMGVDGKLNRNMSRMRTAYDEKPAVKEKSEHSEKSKKSAPKSETLENQLPIIMQK